MKSLCGALLTGVLILGIKYGREKEHLDRFEDLLESYPPVQQLFGWFENEFGSTNCFEITNVDLSQATERAEWVSSGRAEFCNKIVGRTASKVVELMESKV